MFMKLFSKFFLPLMLLSFQLWAVDNPQDNLGAQKYDIQQCRDNASQLCINSNCLNSENRDCQDNCRKLAVHKCNQEINE